MSWLLLDVKIAVAPAAGSHMLPPGRCRRASSCCVQTCGSRKQHTDIVALNQLAYKRQDCPVVYVLVGGARAIAIRCIKFILPGRGMYNTYSFLQRTGTQSVATRLHAQGAQLLLLLLHSCTGTATAATGASTAACLSYSGYGHGYHEQ